MTEHLIEAPTKFSQSLLWKLQRDAYCQFGIDAWNQYGVPSYITSNSFIAKNYAQVVLGYLRDCLSKESIDLTHPIYIVDLGAGTGRLAYLFLKELHASIASSSLPKLNLCYVMTDIASSNIEFWQQNPQLKPYFEQGLLDCAYFHHAQTDPIHLINRKETLSQETLVNPMVLICNYFFDTIPQELFRFRNGQLEEGEISLYTKVEGAIDPAIINQLQCRYSYKSIPQTDSYYDCADLNELLASYSTIAAETPFLFPIGAFQVLKAFKEWSQSSFLLIAADQGVCTPEQIQELPEPKLSLHGSFSFSVNYHSLAAWFQQQNGVGCLTSFPDRAFVVMAGVLGAQDVPETALAFRTHLDSFEPMDYFKLISLLQDEWRKPSLDFMLLLIKLGNWDSNVMNDFFERMRKTLPGATENQKRLLCATIDKVWENFYPTEPAAGSFVLNLGVLLFEMDFFSEARSYFKRSMDITGVNTTAIENIAACNHKLRN
ncbi:MAG: hypothetical protein H0X51_03500 [Parachlamydiaceae bacterium]|nr:hypothetical protein [Parachlamydiaceae bacterium]